MSGTDDEGLQFDSAGADDPLQSSLDKAGLPTEQPVAPPVYRVLPGSRIPVSSKRGSVWKSRKATATKQMADMTDAWDEAIRYYNHDQSDHRDGQDVGQANNRYVARRLNDKHSATENIVFSNINGQIPSLYAKNPIISMTSGLAAEEPVKEVDDAFARAVERLVNILFGMQSTPGVNLKPKAKRAVLIALLTNCAWLEVGYVTKDKSSDQALQNLMDLSDQLAAAKDQQEIEEIEQALVALEEKIEFLRPAGPFVRLRLPHQVLVDGDRNDPYLNDANWVMIEDMLPTDYINAVYGVEDENSEQIYSVFEPTHILDGGNLQDDLDSFTLFDNEKGYSAYGFDDQTQYDKAKRTKVWYVWDKTTRRLEMYSDADWKWPIWVWDDPYQLQNFFPLTPLWFHDNPIAVYAKGEVSYYLDQQDQINEINDERRRSLLWARRNIFYDKTSGVTQETVDKILKGPDATATGIDVPEGKNGKDLIFSIVPPSSNFASLFDKKDLYQSVDRIVSTNEVERGGEFKTNTTNKAIDYYSTMGNQRMDLRLDAIEDFIGQTGWKIAQLCLRFMDAETVQQITGLDVAAFWKPLDNLGDFNKWAMSCVGGSTQKLSTQSKKQEAVQIGQVLSQYVKAAPATVLKTTLKLFSKAFDDMQMTKEDWDAIAQEVATTIAAGQGGAPGVQPGGAPGGPMPPTPDGGPPMPNGGGGGGNPMQLAQVVVQALQQLPPPVLKAIGMALAQGAPPQAILAQMMQSQQAGAGAGMIQ
jgi:hypothetical protein